MGNKALYLNGVYYSDADDSGLFRVKLTEPGEQEVVVIDSQGRLARVLFSFELKPVQANAH
nr:hypothetical protein [Thalassolituus sp.]